MCHNAQRTIIFLRADVFVILWDVNDSKLYGFSRETETHDGVPYNRIKSIAKAQ